MQLAAILRSLHITTSIRDVNCTTLGWSILAHHASFGSDCCIGHKAGFSHRIKVSSEILNCWLSLTNNYWKPILLLQKTCLRSKLPEVRAPSFVEFVIRPSKQQATET
ncbi:uncharacterized protein CLUP02_11239 [Colletotrichum lupini]|uniref:Uncharacterized protein n=1 Tax=Colletotrichum lupini TaxID=145971 RepID=A0A9Q8SYG9_9PEZI|nr:uncharacterized protein CLUP02_11239 [Colletotrichum lupini]UQC85740.1 hypothetical protein CLUP02_11239 [Colletotrichum lupini]